MSLVTSLREHTARIVRDFVACGPKGACSRMTVLALTALGIVVTGGAGNVAALITRRPSKRNWAARPAAYGRKNNHVG